MIDDDDDDDKVPAPLVTAPADRVGLPGVTSNLTTYRYHGPKYTEREEADDIRAAQDGDAAAEDRLVRHHQPMTGEIISKYFGLSYEDKIADGNWGRALRSVLQDVAERRWDVPSVYPPKLAAMTTIRPRERTRAQPPPAKI
jgi:hypothetical protein